MTPSAAPDSGNVWVASPRGFCAGVSYAIEIVDRLLDRYGPPVWVRHEIVHNRYVVERLRSRGARFVDDLADVPPDSLLVFSAHGVAPSVREEARGRGLRVVDATCPLVTKVHLEALRFAREGYDILLVGHRGHVEVEGTLGHAPDQIRLVETEDDVDRIAVRDPDRVAVITQTTLSVDDTRAILAAIRRRFPSVRLPKKDDICYATQNRQQAVKELAGRTDLVLVLGSAASSNARRLVEVGIGRGTRTQRIEDASMLEPEMLAGVRSIGVTAGASTPEALVEETVARLRELGWTEPRELVTAHEDVAFPLPREVRDAAAGTGR
ncbi:MAG: 4-hydroxy-3-methylbut-2-en-yl diphosphate reductase [Candidatus Binatota bacterium]|nr:4-hydroxy-3-methylbut-2-en-yl diphosphate reductase [Candidatus Binatota bacterium]